MYAALALLACSCGYRTRGQIERDYAKQLAPASLQPEAQRDANDQPPASRKMLIRIYADQDYRSEILSWEYEIEEQIRRASIVTEAQFGTVLAIESIRRWDARSFETGLEQTLASLEKLDSGAGVDWVVGFVASTPLITATQDQLGMARLFGRHLVLRGMKSAGDTDEIEQALKHISDRERDALIRDRKLHRETAVFLHEWAHTLGAFHGRSPEFLMCATYRPKQSQFPAETVRVIEIGLKHHRSDLLDRQAFAAWARELGEYIHTTAWPGWDAAARVEALAWTEQVLKTTAESASHAASTMAEVDRQRLDDAIKAAESGKHQEARRQIEPLVERYPNDARVQALACHLDLQAARNEKPAVERCQRAVALAPDDAGLLLRLGHAQLDNEDLVGGQASLLRARQILDSAKKPDRESWTYLASLFHQAGCISWEEQAAEQLGDQERRSFRAEALRVRRWIGLPPPPSSFGVPPEREAEYLAAMRRTETELAKKKLSNAKRSIEALRKDFPDAPGPLGLECDLHLRSARIGTAKASCERALRAYDEFLKGHYLLGLTYAAIGQSIAAARHLERVIDLDPTSRQTWSVLESVLQSAHQDQKLDSLRARYRAQFSNQSR